MSAPISSGGGDLSGGEGGAASAILLVVMAFASLVLLQGDLNQRIMLTVCIAALLFALLAFAPVVGVCAAVGYLSVLGGLKRWLIPVLGFQSNDPLMLVIPTAVAVLFVPHIIRRELPTDTPLSKLILWLFIVMLVQIVNPLQGGLTVGIAGAMFHIVPLLWYYYARFSGTPSMVRALLFSAILISIGTGLYGQYQQFYGFSDTEKLWMRYTGFQLGLGSTFKVYSSLCSTAEYAAFLIVGAILSFVQVLRRKMVFLPLWAGFMVAIFLSGNRGPVIGALGTCVMLWAVQGRSPRVWAPRIAVALTLAFAGLVVGVQGVKTGNIQNDVARSTISNQVEGLSNPLKSSSGSAHISMITGGIWYGITHPLGSGLGASSLAGARLSTESRQDGASFGTELDISNMFVSLGAVGGFLYLAVLYRIFQSALRRWQRHRQVEVLAVFGLLACQFGQLLTGSHYAVTAMLWLLVGSLDRLDALDLAVARAAARRARLEDAEAAAAAAAGEEDGAAAARVPAVRPTAPAARA